MTTVPARVTEFLGTVRDSDGTPCDVYRADVGVWVPRQPDTDPAAPMLLEDWADFCAATPMLLRVRLDDTAVPAVAQSGRIFIGTVMLAFRFDRDGIVTHESTYRRSIRFLRATDGLVQFSCDGREWHDVPEKYQRKLHDWLMH